MTTRNVTTCDQCRKEIEPGWYAYKLHGGPTPFYGGISIQTYGETQTESDFCSFACLTAWVLAESQGGGKG